MPQYWLIFFLKILLLFVSDGQLIEKYKGSGKWWDSKRERWKYEWNQSGTLKAVHSPHRSSPVKFTYDALGRRLSKLSGEYTHWVWNGNVPLHEWNSGHKWEDGGWQRYELDLKTWIFEEESFVPHSYSMARRTAS